VVLRGAEPFYLTTREEKIDLLSQMDLDVIIIQPFTPGLARTRATAFVDMLVQKIGMAQLWVGPDFALGYRREGDIPFLRKMGQQRGFTVNAVKRLRLEGDPISSSRIRDALREGDVTLAARCLGRPYTLQGAVIIGAQRGRSLGFPTANIQVPAERAIPANGVYAAWATLWPESVTNPHQYHLEKAEDKEHHRAVVNIGTRPTFEDGPRTIEAHLLDFDRNIYGQRMIVEFVARLRPERRFDSVEALVEQIRHDTQQARQLLHDPRNKAP
jgi:riboflavin kinase/FMN adenylyltransferase